MGKIECYFCKKELTSLEVRLLDRPYLKVCLNCRNMLHHNAFELSRSKGEEISTNGYLSKG